MRLAGHSSNGFCWDIGVGRARILHTVSRGTHLECDAGALSLAGWSSDPLVSKWIARMHLASVVPGPCACLQEKINLDLEITIVNIEVI